MKGTVSLIDLEVNCIIGIHPEERLNEQKIFLDIHMECDFEPARNSENVSDAIDYSEVAALVIERIQTKKFQLIETLSEDVCEVLFDKYNRINLCKIRVKKPAAVPEARHAMVSIERARV